jgi:3-oxoacyl-[acyl-carrier protein] reductase
MKDLLGKTALVTGAAQGIGQAIAEYLALQGAFVFVADIRDADAVKASDAINKQGCQSRAVKVDVSSVDSVETTVGGIIKEKGSIDILVNNAGVFSNKPVHELSIEEWDRVIRVNLRGTHICSQTVIKYMINRRSGKIINLCSMSAQTGGLKAGVDYTASKGGVAALTKAYARYGAEYNINVNAVAPGFILTEITEEWATKEGAADNIPLKRIGLPLDVAKVVYFLSSSLSDYVTGQTININGGMIMI